MAQFLSGEWLERFDELARTSTALAGISRAGPVIIEQWVSGVPDREEPLRYQLVLGPGPARVDAGSSGEADLVLVTDYAQAVALHTGSVNAQHGLAAGRLRLRGDAERLRDLAEALRGIGDVHRALRAETTFPPGRPADAVVKPDP